MIKRLKYLLGGNIAPICKEQWPPPPVGDVLRSWANQSILLALLLRAGDDEVKLDIDKAHARAEEARDVLTRLWDATVGRNLDQPEHTRHAEFIAEVFRWCEENRYPQSNVLMQ
jgi:hypothetical protein